jgi:hypothetical protein
MVRTMPANHLAAVPDGYSALEPVRWRARAYGLNEARTLEELRAAGVPLLFAAGTWMCNAHDFEAWLEEKYRAAGGTAPMDPYIKHQRELAEALNRKPNGKADP